MPLARALAEDLCFHLLSGRSQMQMESVLIAFCDEGPRGRTQLTPHECVMQAEIKRILEEYTEKAMRKDAPTTGRYQVV